MQYLTRVSFILLLFLFLLATSYVLCFGKCKSGIYFDYLVFTVICGIALVFSGGI